MRVIAGTARRLPLRTPQGMDTRPTTDRIKETLFNILQFDLPGCVFVDLFSGSGGIGIEALSRGAKRAYFIDNDPRAIACIRQNLEFTKFTDRATVLKQDALAALRVLPEERVDLIFLDPPYRQEHEKRALEVLAGMGYVTEETMIVVEAALDTDFSYLAPMGWEVVRKNRYKTNQHIFLRKERSHL